MGAEYMGAMAEWQRPERPRGCPFRGRMIKEGGNIVENGAEKCCYRDGRNFVLTECRQVSAPMQCRHNGEFYDVGKELWDGSTKICCYEKEPKDFVFSPQGCPVVEPYALPEGWELPEDY